jgi:hypothetical protein
VKRFASKPYAAEKVKAATIFGYISFRHQVLRQRTKPSYKQTEIFMSLVRFALLFFLFLLGMRVFAQEDDQDYNRRKKLAYTTCKRTIRFTTRNDLPHRVPNLDSEDTLEIKFQSFDTTDFAQYVDEIFFDSTISYYNSSNFRKMLSENVDFSSPTEIGDLESHYKLFSKIYGIIKNPIPLRREILSFRKEFKLAFLTYKVSFKGAEGELSITLNVAQKGVPSFWAMEFTAYDYNQIPFFLSISALQLEYIKSRNISALKKDVSKLFFWSHQEKIEKIFERMNFDSAQLFKSSLVFLNKEMPGFNDVGRSYARVVYDLPKEDKYLRLEFVTEDNKFKLEDLVFIDKKRE